MYYFLFVYSIVFALIFHNHYVRQLKTVNNLPIPTTTTRKRTRKQRGLMLWCLILAFPFIYLSTLRDYSIGTDTNGTYKLIYYTGYAVHKWKVPLYESLYIYFVKLMYAVNSDYRFLLFATSAVISIGFIAYFLKRAKELNTSVCLCGFIVLIFCFSLNGQRQVLAMTMALLFFDYLESKRPFYALIVLILIAFVHVTGLVLGIYFIPYFFKDRKNAQKIIPALFFVAPVLLPLIIYFVSRISIFSRFQRYINAFDIQSINTKYFVFPLLMLPLIMLYWDKLIRLRENNFLHMCGYIFTFSAILLSGYLWYAFRILYYFAPSEIIIISQLEKCCKKKHKLIINAYIALSLIVYFIFVYVMHDTDEIYPYILAK